MAKDDKKLSISAVTIVNLWSCQLICALRIRMVRTQSVLKIFQCLLRCALCANRVPGRLKRESQGQVCTADIAGMRSVVSICLKQLQCLVCVTSSQVVTMCSDLCPRSPNQQR